MSETSHVFVVGTSRSGTSLLRNTLNSSDEIAITGETHFLGGVASLRCIYEYLSSSDASQAMPERSGTTGRFGHTGLRDRIRAKGKLSDPKTVEAVADMIMARSGGFWESRSSLIDRGDLLSGLREADSSDAAVFDLLMRLYAGEKPRRGEKTPSHVFHVPTLLSWFPDARVVHIIRDLRAVYVSQQKKKMKQKGEKITRRHQLVRRNRRLHEYYVMANISAHWVRVAQLDGIYRRAFPDRYLSLRYEDFVVDPETNLSRICSFCGIDYSSDMLSQVFVNSSIVGRHWDQGSETGPGAGIDPGAANRWKEHLSAGDDRFLKWIGRKPMKALRYLN